MRLHNFLAAAFLAWPSAAGATAALCPGHYLNDVLPDFAKLAQAAPTRELCYKSFTVTHSGATRTPLWSAEHLTAEDVTAAANTIRANRYHAEAALQRRERAELADYSKSGYDRGHMAPFLDMPDADSQWESFSLANMVPQAPKLNRGLWERIEATVRGVATVDGDAWVVTGPLFLGSNVQALRGRVLVPTQTWKAVYDPKRDGAAVYVTDNSAKPNCRILTVEAFTALSGIDPFPALPPAVAKLPLTQPRGCK